MRSSYKKEDVILLLKDITGLVEPQSTVERERLIQSGKHYCEMLPIEYLPSEKYMDTYRGALKNYAKSTALAIGCLSDKIANKKGKEVVLVSLARAGIPIGILVKRYLKWKYKFDVQHYSLSIIRGKGIDNNAIKYILERHNAKDILFVDGWIGKGAILKELEKDISEFPEINPELAVVADPANITEMCGTHDDILIASSCLNSTVSGLISRTFLRDDIIGKDDFHGAVYYGEMKEQDLSYEFIEEIEKNFELESIVEDVCLTGKGIEEVENIAKQFDIANINLVKPGIGETTRVLLRRVPWKVLISDKWRGDISLEHIIRLAEEKNVPIEYFPLLNYKSCGIIKKLADA
ncbi:MAG: cysteine protease StiP family protein [Lachnotalea sp.]